MRTATDSIPARRAASQSQVESPTITASFVPGLVQRRLHEVGLGLGGLHVGGGGPAVHHVASAEQVEVVVHLVPLAELARTTARPRSLRSANRSDAPSSGSTSGSSSE